MSPFMVLGCLPPPTAVPPNQTEGEPQDTPLTGVLVGDVVPGADVGGTGTVEPTDEDPGGPTIDRAPSITIDSMTINGVDVSSLLVGGEVLSGPTARLNFTVSDPDSSALVSVIFDTNLDPTDGFSVLSQNLEENTDFVDFDTRLLPKSVNLFFAVRADDGFNSIVTEFLDDPSPIRFRSRRLVGTLDLISLSETINLDGFERLFSGAKFPGFNFFDEAGTFLLPLGDLDADGFGDFAVVAPTGKPGTGDVASELYMIYGDDDRYNGEISLNSVAELAKGKVFHSAVALCPFGSGLVSFLDITFDDIRSIPDITGDGFPDIMAGDKEAAFRSCCDGDEPQSIFFGGSDRLVDGGVVLVFGSEEIEANGFGSFQLFDSITRWKVWGQRGDLLGQAVDSSRLRPFQLLLTAEAADVPRDGFPVFEDSGLLATIDESLLDQSDGSRDASGRPNMFAENNLDNDPPSVDRMTAVMPGGIFVNLFGSIPPPPITDPGPNAIIEFNYEVSDLDSPATVNLFVRHEFRDDGFDLVAGNLCRLIFDPIQWAITGDEGEPLVANGVYNVVVVAADTWNNDANPFGSSVKVASNVLITIDIPDNNTGAPTAEVSDPNTGYEPFRPNVFSTNPKDRIEYLYRSEDFSRLQSGRDAGDFNADGTNDWLLGRPRAEVGPLIDAGRTYLYFGRILPPHAGNLEVIQGVDVQRFERDPLDPEKRGGLVFNGVKAGEMLGGHNSTSGDFDGDGLTDIAIGSPNFDACVNGTITIDPATSEGTCTGGGAVERIDSGAVFVLFGDRELITDEDGNPITDIGSARFRGVTFWGEEADDLAGTNVRSAGDLDGDGTDDLIFAAPGSDPIVTVDGVEVRRANAGAAYVIYGSKLYADMPGPHDLRDVGEGFTLSDGVIPGARFAGRQGAGAPVDEATGEGDIDGSGDRLSVITQAGDVDGDGFPDLLLGAPKADRRFRVDSGEAYLIYLDGDLAR
jgi:hypothetical protein